MKRFSLLILSGLIVQGGGAAIAQTSTGATPASCRGLSPVAERACYAAQNAAADHASEHTATKQNRKEAIAAARTSTDTPQAIAVRLLAAGYSDAALKRYRTQLLSSPGHPIVANGQFVYTTPAAYDADDRKAALYIQLLRIIGKTNLPPSALKAQRAQLKAIQKLVALESARANGQPGPKHVPGLAMSAATPAALAAAPTPQCTDSPAIVDEKTGRITESTCFVFPPLSGGQEAVQTVDGSPSMTIVPIDSPISLHVQPRP